VKIVARPIDVIAVFKGGERPIPYKFRYTESDGRSSDVKIDRILVSDEQRVAGQRSFIYECQSEIDGCEKRYQLKYLIPEARWLLYKI
jgi:hypothetical protein